MSALELLVDSKNFEAPESSLVIDCSSSCFFIEFGDEPGVGLGGLGPRLETENVLFVEVGIPDVRIARDDGAQHEVWVGLAQDLEGRAAVDGGIRHREEESSQP